jgi:carbon storage regulator
MLIITRRKGQRITLGHDIEIVITDISRSGVKIGVLAPTSLTILRGEVRDAVEQANRAAASSDFAAPTLQTAPAPVALGAAGEAHAALGPSAAEPVVRSEG